MFALGVINWESSHRFLAWARKCLLLHRERRRILAAQVLQCEHVCPELQLPSSLHMQSSLYVLHITGSSIAIA